jgi:hypothetical protein
MGYDYSGGGLGGPERHWAETIKRIRAGETNGQKNRALLDKAMFAGVGAGIGAIGHSMESAESMEKQANQRKEGVMRDAIADQTKQSAFNDKIRGQSQKYAEAGSEYETNPYGAAPVPDWLKQAHGDHGENPYVGDAATAALDSQNMNSAAAGAAIGGYRPPSGLDDVHNDADTRAADISTGKNLMKTGSMMGGMGSTLPRSQ